jgi:hypothetical protein
MTRPCWTEDEPEEAATGAGSQTPAAGAGAGASRTSRTPSRASCATRPRRRASSSTRRAMRAWTGLYGSPSLCPSGLSPSPSLSSFLSVVATLSEEN